MQLDLYLVDWKDAQKRHEQSVLRESISDASSGKSKWIEDLCWLDKQPANYFDVALVCEALDRPEGVSEKAHEAALSFLNVLITDQDFHNDLEGSEGDFLLAISPEAAVRFYQLVEQVDFSVYRDQFEASCPAVDIEADDAIKFIILWVQIISDAAKQKKGLLAVLE